MPAPPDQRTFVLGVGCQKGGTAWLHRYLEASAQCDPGFRKEYHVWDGVDLPTGRGARNRVAQAARTAGRALASGEPADADALRRALFYADPESYLDYFTSLLDREGVRVTADITPAYAVLSEDRLRWIRDGFAARGVRCVPVFLMRDPVERLWSAVRMVHQRRGDLRPGAAEAAVGTAASLPYYAERTRYDVTLARLESVFGPGTAFVGFYERLFDPTTLRTLCAHLGLDYHEPDLGQRVNASVRAEGESLPPEVVGDVARRFADVYRDVAGRYPEIDLASLWPSSAHVLG